MKYDYGLDVVDYIENTESTDDLWKPDIEEYNEECLKELEERATKINNNKYRKEKIKFLASNYKSEADLLHTIGHTFNPNDQDFLDFDEKGRNNE